MIDISSAEKLGLQYMHARGSEFGKYMSPGNVIVPYYGLIRGPIQVQFDSNVVITLQWLKVVNHREPLLLLGADCLRGGRAPS